jgi:hypothetical protein
MISLKWRENLSLGRVRNQLKAKGSLYPKSTLGSVERTLVEPPERCPNGRPLETYG